MATGPVSSQLSDSWTNLAAVGPDVKAVSFPRRANRIKGILEQKLAILSGGRDESGREIIVFPARPKSLKYDHTQLLQTLQYLSIIPNPEALELGFAVIVDGRWLSWSDIKLILRTSQEALPGQVHVVYVLQPSQFVNKKQVSMSLAKEKEKLEFTIVKVSSVEKLLRHVDRRQVTVELGGNINYKHDEWLTLRLKLEELTDAYQLYLETASEYEGQLRANAGRQPESPMELQTALATLMELKPKIEMANDDLHRLATEYKRTIETISGSTGMTPERVNSLAKVNKIVQLSTQQQSLLLDLYSERYRLLNQSNSMKQFDLGITKVMHWIKSKGLDEASSVDIGDSLTAVLTLNEKLAKLAAKVESMKEDITELKRLADVMLGTEHCDREKIKSRLSKMMAKYSKFTSVYEQRNNLISRAVRMYKGLEEWRELYDKLTVEWARVKNMETQIDDCEQLIQSLDKDNGRLKELAQTVLMEGQELVKALKETGVSQGDPEFRRSLRYISRTTDEVTDKARRSQEIALAKYARLDQYSQILLCEKDGRESINKLCEILATLKGRSSVIGETLEATQNYLMELEEHKREVDHTTEYASGLLKSAFNQRQSLEGDLVPNESLQSELNEVSLKLEDTFQSVRSLLQRLEKLQTVYEGTKASVGYWTGQVVCDMPWSDIEKVLVNMEEKGDDMKSAITICLKLGRELKELLVSNGAQSDYIEYLDELNQSLTDQEVLLTSALTIRRKELIDHKHLLSLHQSNEEILVWIREQGLPHLNAYCSLKFNVKAVKDSMTEFITFKETVESLSGQIERVFNDLPKETNDCSQSLLLRVSKRMTDLQNIWKRFLMRVENRERVLSSLDQFLTQVIKLTSMMTEYLRKSSSEGTKRDRADLDSSYHWVLTKGRNLIALLHQSPGGTSDWEIAEAVNERLGQLTQLHKKVAPFVEKEGAGNETASNGGEVGNGMTESSRPLSEEKEKRVINLLKEMESKRKQETVIINGDIDDEAKGKKQRGGEAKQSEDKVEERTAAVKVEGRKREEEGKKLEQKPMEDEQLKEDEKTREEERMEADQKHEEERREDERLKDNLKKPEELQQEKKRRRSKDEETNKEQMTKTVPIPLALSSDDFQHLEQATDQLLQKLLNCVSSFLKSHGICPSTISGAVKELREHDEFLQSLQSSISELHVMSQSLKAHTSTVIKQKVLYLVDRIDRRVRERVSVVEKRITALRMIQELHDINEKCYAELKSFDSLVTAPIDLTTLSTTNIKVLLENYESVLIQLEASAGSYGSKTRSFTALSSELEMSGVEARRVMRGNLRQFEVSLSSSRQSYHQRKQKMELVLRTSDASEKQKKLLSWLTDIGLPVVSTVALGTSVKESSLLLEEAQLFAREAKVIGADIDSTLTEVAKLSLPSTSDALLGAEELKKTHQLFIERSSTRLQALETSYEFFRSASMLLADLTFALNQGPELNECVFNPILAENQYSILTAHAKRLCLLACHDENKGTVACVNELLAQVDAKLSVYLVACEKSFEDLELSLSKLDTFLEEIDESVKEQLLYATGERKREEEEERKDAGSVKPVPSEGSDKAQYGSFKRSERPRLGSVHELKKKFEVKDDVPVSPAMSPMLPVKSMKINKPPATSQESPTEKQPPSPLKGSLQPSSPTISRTRITFETSPPHSPTVPVSIVKSQVSPIPSPPLVKKLQPTHLLPADSFESDNSLPPTPPPLPPGTPPRPPPPADTPVSFLTDEEEEKNEEEEEKIEGGSIENKEEITEESTAIDNTSTSLEEANPELMENNEVEVEEDDDEMLPDLIIPHDFEDDAYIDVYEEMLLSKQELGVNKDRVTVLGREEGPGSQTRILSPVFEDEEYGRDRPDAGHSGGGGGSPRRTSKTRMNADAQWTHAHRQSLQSMRAILSHFYKDEVEYTETVNRLFEVYSPILQYTGAFIQIQELVDFQLQFLNQLTASLSNITDLCTCFQVNMENFKLYFPFVICYDTSLASLSQCSTDELITLTGDESSTNEQLISDYSAPYYRIEIYCNLFQRLLQAAYKEDLMSLAALSETLEGLLAVLRKLSTEVAATRLYGCPFSFNVSEFLSASPFLIHIANREKEVLMYMAFLHPEAIILAERQLDESRERTQYIYVMHLSTKGLLLIENYHGLTDRFAIFEKNQTSPDNIVVFRACEDVSVKNYWVRELQCLLNDQASELTPQGQLQPEMVEQLGYMIPTDAPPPPKPDQKLNPLRHKRKRGKDNTDGVEDTIDSNYSQIHRVVVNHSPSPSSNHQYITVSEGDLVNVLGKNGLNSLVVTIPADSSDEEEEGYVPTCCLEPIDTANFQLVLNQNNNNSLLSPSPVQHDNGLIGSINALLEATNSALENGEGEVDSLERDWREFCLMTGQSESFPNCQTESELMQEKMRILIKYHSVQPREEEREINEDKPPTTSPPHINVTERHRRLLYQAPFLGISSDEEPSSIQLDGVFSLPHPYMATETIESDSIYQVSLREGQLVHILDSKRDDWWLVSTFPEGDVEAAEGWVECKLLQHADYIRGNHVTDEPDGGPGSTFNISLWTVLADYVAGDEGTVSVNKGNLVEVIDNSQVEWALIRTIGQYPQEGWIPSDFISPYNVSDHQATEELKSPLVRPTSAGADSSSTEGYFDNSIYPISPSLSIGELNDEEKKREAAEHRDFTLSELLGSEREYIERLAYCINHYKATIDDVSGNSLTPRSLKTLSGDLFCNIEDIYNFHKDEMLPQLEKSPEDIVDLFALSGPQMKRLYVTYCKGKHRSEEIYKDHIEYLQELSHQLKDRLSLRDYLILPIQRITKYNLLLKSLFELSSKAGTPVPHYKSALTATQEISRQANDVVHMSLIEGIEKRLEEFGQLGLQDTFGVSDSQQRGIVKERRVFLFEKSLVITKRRTDGSEKGTYITKETFMLQNVSFSEDTDAEKRNIVIYDISTGNKFTLKATLTKVRNEWLSKAQEFISVVRRPPLPFFGASSRSRSASEPSDLVVTSTAHNKQAAGATSGPLRQGSQKSTAKRVTRSGRPSSASHTRGDKPKSGTEFVVMECVVLEGGDDCQLEPKEIVELVRVEPSGVFRVRTSDGQEGVIPPGFVRKRDAVTEGAMETAPKITIAPPDQTLLLHERFSVSCAFNGMPPPSVIWKCDDEVIEDNDGRGRVHISSCPTSSVLEIKDLLYSNEGQYSCAITNSLGSDTATMDLFMEGPPLAPSKPIASHSTTTSVKLKWSPPEHDGHNPITSYLVEQLQNGFEDWRPIVQQLKTTFTVKTLDPNTWYQFRIIACNEQGSSEPSPPSEKVYTIKSKGWMSPVTKRRFLLDTESGKDEVDMKSPIAIDDDLSRTSSAVILESSDTIVRQDSVHTSYDVLPGELGRGRFGIVRKCVNKFNGSVLAAKYLKESSEWMQEVKILRNLSSPVSFSLHVVGFVDAFLTEENLVIITEIVDGGELIDWILSSNTLTEGMIIDYIKQLLSALDFMHERHIVHLDIKPENILLTSGPAAKLKVVDFGTAQEMPHTSSAIRPDNIEFSSPEVVFEDNVTKYADMWSTGVLVYVLFSGVSPFFNESTVTMSQKLNKAHYDLSLQFFHQASPQALDFISSLLRKQPSERLSAASALEHMWIKTALSDIEKQPKLNLTRLAAFQARRKLLTQSKAAKTTSIFNPNIHRLHSLSDPDSNDITESAPIFESGTEEIQAPIGASVTLEWDYTGYPEPSVQWERNERPVLSSGRVQMSTMQGVTRLSIVEVVKADEGTYTCCILNSLGSDIRKSQLVVIDKPAPPSNISGVLLGSSTSVLVSWLPPINDGHSPIINYILEARQLEDNDWISVSSRVEAAAHVVEDLLPGKSYLFRVASMNVIGASQFSKPSSPILITNDEDSPPCSTPLLTDLQVRYSDFDLEYELISEIGRGSFCVVYESAERSTDRSFAAKFIPFNNEEEYAAAVREFEMNKKVSHPRIASLEDAFRSPTHVILVQQYVPCGDLLSFVNAMSPLDEQQSARFIRHILEGLEYLHNRNIILINIAPDNLILGVGCQEVKIVDFSYAQCLDSNPHLEALPQDISYFSPESLELHSLSPSTDMWSVGAVALFMLSGRCPFSSQTRDQLINDICSLRLSSECNEVIQGLSPDCYDVLFDGLLVLNPKKRLSSHQGQRHRWLQVGASTTALVPQLNQMDTMEQVEYFMQKYPLHFHSNSDPS